MQLYPYPTPEGIIDLVRKTEYDTLFQSLCEAEELIREIRDNEVNAQDEATKFLRDHKPSELSKLRSELAASNASSENELLQMVQADNIQLLQQNKRLIDARNKLRADNAELIDRLREARESHLHTAARDVQTIQRQSVELSKLEAEINQEVAENTNLRQSLHDAKKLAGQLAEAVKRMEAVSLNSLIETYREEIDDALHSFEDRDEALSSDKVVEIAMEAVRARLIQAVKDHAETPANTATAR